MFGAKSVLHWVIVGIVLLLLFGGRNKISDLMGDLAKGIKSFKKGMKDEDAPAPAEPMKTIDFQGAAGASEKAAEARKAG